MAITDGTQFGRVGAFRFWCQKVLPAVYDDSLSYYELLCKVIHWLEELTEVTNTQSDAIKELQETLQDFLDGEITPYIEQVIDNWFEENEPAIVADISSLEDRVGNLETEMNTVWHNYYQYTGKNIVFLGDSYLAPGIPNSEYEWLATNLSSRLGMTKFNYAYGGAGFARPTNLIETQQVTASTQMTAQEKADTAIVLCMAGCNDLLNLDLESITQQDIVDGMNDYISWAATTYPNAKIVLVPFNWGFSHLTFQINRLITNVMNSINSAAHSKGVLFIYGAWLWNLGIASRFRNQNHPNEYGYHVIMDYILNALEGSQGNIYSTANDVFIDNEEISDTSQQFHYNVIDGIVHINGYIRPVNEQSGIGTQIELKDVGELPAIITPNNSIVCMPLFSATQGVGVGYIVIRNDGSMVCKFNNVSANEVCTFNYNYIAEVGVDWSDYVS